MTRRLEVLICILLISLLTACKHTPEMKYEEYDKGKEFSTFFLVEHSETDDNFCIVSDADFRPLISSDRKYIYDIKYALHIKDYLDGRRKGERRELKECRIRVYDTEDLNILYDFDMKGLLEPYLGEYQLPNNTLGTGIKQGKQVIMLELQRIPTDEEIISGIYAEHVKFWLDIEAGTVKRLEPEDHVEIIEYESDSENLWMLLGTTILPDEVSVDNYLRIENSSYIQISTNMLATHNKKLYNMFPGLKGIKKEKERYVYLFLFPKTDNMEALSLILDDYEELDFSKIEKEESGFYGMYKDRTGKGHRITEDEYKQFQEDYWEYRKKQREDYGSLLSVTYGEDGQIQVFGCEADRENGKLPYDQQKLHSVTVSRPAVGSGAWVMVEKDGFQYIKSELSLRRA